MNKKMRLSTAMRLGSLLRPQANGDILRDGKTCAIGAAADVIYKDLSRIKCQDQVVHRMIKEWPYLRKIVPYPASRLQPEELRYVIFELNDRSHWSREKIATWIEGLEDEWGIPNPPLDELAPEPSNCSPAERDFTRELVEV